MKLRDYQDYAVGALFEFFKHYLEGNPLVVMPTGTGKSLVIGEFIRRTLTRWPGQQIMMLTHVKELIGQDHEKLLALWPEAPAGIYSAGLDKKEHYMPIIFGGIASVVRADPKIFGRVDLVIIDEAHLVSPKDETMYGRVIAALMAINPNLRVIGLTATDYRLGHGRLTLGSHLFTHIAIDMSKKQSFNWFIQQGYLCPLIPKRAHMEVDATRVKLKGGEFDDKAAQAAFDKNEITYKACKEMVSIAAAENRNHWLVFAQGVQHAIHVTDMLDSLGVDARVVHSDLIDTERDQNIADFKAGKFTALVNNGIMTTGHDIPFVDLIGVLRMTMSTNLWVQMLGRGTRPLYALGFDLDTQEGRLAAIAASTKQNCLVLDFAGNTKRLGPINDPVIPEPKGSGKAGDAPVKVCEECFCYNYAGVRFCEYCGHEFPRYLKLKARAGTDELIAGDDPRTTSIFNVDRVVYKAHIKPNKIPSLKVTYHSGMRAFTMYVCIQHEGFAGKKARDWWRSSANSLKIPNTLEDAMKQLNTLRDPRRIKVLFDNERPEVIDYEFE